MKRYRKPLTPTQIAAAKDEDMDFSDVPELEETFWWDAEIVEPRPKEHGEARPVEGTRSLPVGATDRSPLQAGKGS
ncbi:MAG: hypothetical protein OXU42_08925 [Deltaproteobacteria bacterium]|nr:hypothetical protein [Deltaproteobacteria bacterium]